MARIVSFLVLVAISIVIGVVFFQVMAGFLLPLFLAVLLVVMFRPLHLWMISKCSGRERLAAGLTTLSILLIVLLPLLWIFGQAAGEVVTLLGNWDPQVASQKMEKLRRRFGLELPPKDVREGLATLARSLGGWHDAPPQGDTFAAQVDVQLQVLQQIEAALNAGPPARPEAPRWREPLRALRERLTALQRQKPAEDRFKTELDAAIVAQERLNEAVLGGNISRWIIEQAEKNDVASLSEKAQRSLGQMALGGAQAAGGVLSALLVGLGVMIVSLYYFLADGPSMIKTIMRLSPLDDKYEQQLLDEFATLSRAVVVATLASALTQGLLALPAYVLCGFDSVFLLTMVTMFVALIPFVGAAAVWIPCSLWLLLYEERTAAAACLAVYGVAVISMADNLIKPWVLKGRSNLHPLLALLSVLGGVQAMGPIGILVGPMVAAFLQTLLNMLHTELQTFHASPQQPLAAAAVAAPAPAAGP